MQFWEYDFQVSQILLVVEVVGAGEPVHRNRPSHGLVYVPEGRYTYAFEDGRSEIIRPGEMFYLPNTPATWRGIWTTDDALPSILT